MKYYRIDYIFRYYYPIIELRKRKRMDEGGNAFFYFFDLHLETNKMKALFQGQNLPLIFPMFVDLKRSTLCNSLMAPNNL